MMHYSTHTLRSIHYQPNQNRCRDTKIATSSMLEDVATKRNNEQCYLLHLLAAPSGSDPTKTDSPTHTRMVTATMIEVHEEDMDEIEDHQACRMARLNTMTEGHYLLQVEESQRIDRPNATALYHDHRHRTVTNYHQDLTICQVGHPRFQLEDHHQPIEDLREVDRTSTLTSPHIRAGRDRDMTIEVQPYRETIGETHTTDNGETVAKATEIHTAIRTHHGNFAMMVQVGRQDLEAIHTEIAAIRHHETSSVVLEVEVLINYAGSVFRTGSGIFIGVRRGGHVVQCHLWAMKV